MFRTRGGLMRIRLLAALLATQFTVLAAGQRGPAQDQEAVAIRNANEVYMSPDTGRVKGAFYSPANLYTEDGKGGLRIIPLEQFLANLAKGEASGQSRPTMTIDFIDHAGSAATVRVTEISDVARVTDYFSLVRDAPGWKLEHRRIAGLVRRSYNRHESHRNNTERLCALGTQTRGAKR